MSLTLSQLSAALPYATEERLAAFIDPLNRAMEEYGITTPARRAAFLAQVAHESGSLLMFNEIALALVVGLISGLDGRVSALERRGERR